MTTAHRRHLDAIIEDLIFCEDNLTTLAPAVAQRLLNFIPAVLSCEVGHTVTQAQWDELYDCAREYDRAVGLTDSHYWSERLDAARYAILRPAVEVAS